MNRDHARVGYYKSILDQAGIPNFVRNEDSHNSMTEMPSPIIFPALCVLQDENYDRAMEILGAIYYAPASTEPDWRCEECGEIAPGTFDSCWQCGTARSDAPG